MKISKFVIKFWALATKLYSYQIKFHLVAWEVRKYSQSSEGHLRILPIFICYENISFYSNLKDFSW